MVASRSRDFIDVSYCSLAYRSSEKSLLTAGSKLLAGGAPKRGTRSFPDVGEEQPPAVRNVRNSSAKIVPWRAEHRAARPTNRDLGPIKEDQTPPTPPGMRV